MKKLNIIIIIFFMCFCLISCNDRNATCKINYSVVYPDTTITYDTIFNYAYNSSREYSLYPYTSSLKGTNYIKLGYYNYVRTTCPIRINSYKIIKK